MEKIKIEYKSKKDLIKKRLSEFSDLNEKDYFSEFLFCLLTPQSNAKKCWVAVNDIIKLKKFEENRIKEILRDKTRFHNNKSKYIVNSKETWNKIKNSIKDIKDKKALRNFLADNVKGYGLKEAGHFLRNIGKSENQIAILDRHILRNLKNLGVIEEEEIKNKDHYYEIEKKFLDFSVKIGIPIDELDLLFWSRENGEIFK
jgi:N-glycosylase/DNA lyase